VLSQENKLAVVNDLTTRRHDHYLRGKRDCVEQQSANRKTQNYVAVDLVAKQQQQ
jgi:hypothetical protein